MIWEKKGLLIAPDKKFSWRQKYCMMPTPIFLEDRNVIRVYYGTTDLQNNGRTTFVDLDADNPSKVIYHSNEITLDLGRIGSFDDSGCVPSCYLISNEGKDFLYYVGFQRCEKVPYMLFSGLAEKINEKFSRISEAPIIDRTLKNFLSNAAPFVIYDHDNDIYKMWFWLGKEWVINNNKLYIKAEIHYTESNDGIEWKNKTYPCIVLNDYEEFSVGRPCVIKDNGKFKMWYSIRKKDVLYRIGYAESPDGIHWERKDSEVGIDVSDEGWDSEMICYPAVIKVKEKTFMFYNGNNNGETGFGYAELLKN